MTPQPETEREVSREVFSLVCRAADAEKLARALGRSVSEGLRAPSESRDLVVDRRAGEAILLCADPEEVVSSLKAAEAIDVALRFAEGDASRGAPSLVTQDAPIYTHAKHGGSWKCLNAANHGGFVQTRSRYGDVIERREVTLSGARVTTATAIAEASPRLTRYLQRKRIGRAEGLFSSEKLAQWLSASAPCDFAVLLAIEERLGGLVGEPAWPGLPDLRFGPWLVQSLKGELFAEGRAEGDPGEEQVWPFFRWDEAELCLVGTLRQLDHDLAVNREGHVYLCDRELGVSRIMAETASCLFEKFALVDELQTGMGRLAPLVIEADLGADFAEAAGASLVEEASDALVAHHLGEDVWIRRQACAAPNRAETSIVTTRAEALVRLARLALDRSPSATMRVQTMQTEGAERLEALRAAGLTEVRGQR